MALRHPTVIAWEQTLKRIFDDLDARLEALYGDRFPLRPNRPRRGATANPEHDGLFNVGAAFTLGHGSKHGRGYLIEIRVATPAPVPAQLMAEIRAAVADHLRRHLPTAFPGRALELVEDGGAFKIVGDLSLGRA